MGKFSYEGGVVAGGEVITTIATCSKDDFCVAVKELKLSYQNMGT